ncbi:hypothetical protein RHMOL_Rhmol04G0062800 [Rhododendron molle]|uniref:Uncharacterized protein n=3 Tax=Rhododendron molle TaxID=49168 RepID=A0ACC0NZT0_RHOML|nr:hypothetical protein RHMOL_Rhmol04G0062100 [Rhododendron molle]KAI8558100.1 hypothetical protein RHMOL_Rhmol04G0062500 [Rhododendron molle]KAI8558103.1 hypothetical protein RHMOL_Rhmol04G0062800 [Rhododendron molle]
MMVSWTKPKPGCFKLNTDGASKGNPGASSCGGIIRDSDGKWFSGFHRKIGFASSIEAELWALRDGLILAMSKGLGRGKLEVEVDATLVLELINDRANHHDDLQLQDLVSQCRWLLEQFGLTTPKHIYREANRCADTLANYHVVNRDTTQDGWPDFKSAPTCVEDKMLADASGALYRRTLYE